MVAEFAARHDPNGSNAGGGALLHRRYSGPKDGCIFGSGWWLIAQSCRTSILFHVRQQRKLPAYRRVCVEVVEKLRLAPEASEEFFILLPNTIKQEPVKTSLVQNKNP
jgi:hypothetical protein